MFLRSRYYWYFRGFDKVLLVEGPTVVQTIQQFLRRYGKDHKIVLLPLGGAALINSISEFELYELKRISNNIAALIDSERNSQEETIPKERQAFLENCYKVKILCHILELRATENYFPERAIKSHQRRKIPFFGTLSEAQ